MLTRKFNIYRFNAWLWALARGILLIGLSFVILYPIIQKLSMAFRAEQDIYNLAVVWIPENLTMRNIKIVYSVLDYFPTVGMTALVSGIAMLLQTVTCALAGYGFAKLKFPGSNFLFACAIFTILVPAQTIMVPLYLQFQNFDFVGLVQLFTGKPSLNLINTPWPLYISSALGMGLKSGLYIYIFRQFFRGVPKELEEAACVDGAGIIRTFFQISLPNAIPAIITVMLFAFVWQWNDTFFASLYMGNTDLLAVRMGFLETAIVKEITGQGSLLNLVDPFYRSMLRDTAILFMMAPLILLYLFVQKYFVESIERSGLNG